MRRETKNSPVGWAALFAVFSTIRVTGAFVCVTIFPKDFEDDGDNDFAAAFDEDFGLGFEELLF